MISLIAVLKAKPGQTDALRQALQALLLPTRQERATSTMPCFSCATRRTPSICARRGRDRTPSMSMSRCPIFRRFMAQMESLLAEPLRLDFLTPVEP